jgi:hypothetical protein
MKKSALLFLALFVALISYSQEESATNNGKKGRTYLLVPFESKMYISDIDKKIYESDGLGTNEIRAKFQASLDQNLFINAKEMGLEPLSFYVMEVDAQKELSYIYSSIGYKYEVLPKEENKEEDQTVTDKLKNKFKPKEEKQKQPESNTTNGEITTQRITEERYMQTTITNNNLLQTLVNTYQVDGVIFINQIDLLNNIVTDGSGKHNRLLKVHYTIYDTNGNIIQSGAEKTYFPANVNSVDKISKTAIAENAKKIIEKIKLIQVEPSSTNSSIEVLH